MPGHKNSLWHAQPILCSSAVLEVTMFVLVLLSLRWWLTPGILCLMHGFPAAATQDGPRRVGEKPPQEQQQKAGTSFMGWLSHHRQAANTFLFFLMLLERREIPLAWCCRGGCSCWNACTSSCTVGFESAQTRAPCQSLPAPRGISTAEWRLVCPSSCGSSRKRLSKSMKTFSFNDCRKNSFKIMSLFQMMDQKQHWHFLLKKFSQHLGTVTVSLSTLLTFIQSYDWNKMKLSTSKSTGNLN